MTLAEKYMGLIPGEADTDGFVLAMTHDPSECWWCRNSVVSLADMARDILVRDDERAGMVTVGTEETPD